MPNPGLLHSEALPLQRSTVDPDLLRRRSHTVRAQCRQGFWVLLHASFGLCLQESVSPVLYKFWQLCGGVNGDLLQEGLCQTQVCLTQSPCPSGRPLLTCTSTGHTQMFNIILNDLYSY